jgi:hypothetical protein
MEQHGTTYAYIDKIIMQIYSFYIIVIDWYPKVMNSIVNAIITECQWKMLLSKDIGA